MSQPSEQPPQHLPPLVHPAAPSPTPPPPANDAIYRQHVARWFGLGAIRLTYRAWTRIAAHLFPEGSPQERLMEAVGIPMPDRLDYSWIDSHLAVGGRVRPEDIPRLAKVGITRVVDVRSEHQDDEAALKAHGIDLLYLPTPDTYPLSIADLCRGANWIVAQRKAGARVLVHCEHGVGRSVLLAAAALVCEGKTARQAFEYIAGKRWQASPNRRQVMRLIEFERAGGCGCEAK